MWSAKANPIPESNATWILVANKAAARLFASDGGVKNLRLCQDFDNPQAKMKNLDLVTDGEGSKFGGSGRQHGTGPTDAKLHPAQLFAVRLAETLHKGRAENAYHKLVLIADPEFLGEIKNRLDNPTSALITKSHDKNLIPLPAQDLMSRLHDILKV